MQDVSDKLLGQFASCLETKLGASRDAAPEPMRPLQPEPAEAPSSPNSARRCRSCAAKHRAAEQSAAMAPGPAQPRRRQPEVAELDLGATVLPVLIKTYAPRIIAGLVVLWLLKKLFSR